MSNDKTIGEQAKELADHIKKNREKAAKKARKETIENIEQDIARVGDTIEVLNDEIIAFQDINSNHMHVTNIKMHLSDAIARLKQLETALNNEFENLKI